jgi:hypothetical protein
MTSLLPSLWQSLVALFWTRLLEMFHYDSQTQPWIDCRDLPLSLLDSRDMISSYRYDFDWMRSMRRRNRSLLPSSSQSIGKIHCKFSLLRSVASHILLHNHDHNGYCTSSIDARIYLKQYMEILSENSELVVYLQFLCQFVNEYLKKRNDRMNNKE